MTADRTTLREEVDALKAKGLLLYVAMLNETGKLDAETSKRVREKKAKLPSFRDEYDRWYSVALRVVKQVLPDRLADFTEQYKLEKRKEIDWVTYTISDYLLGVEVTRGIYTVDGSAAILKMKKQTSILESAVDVIDSAISDLQEVLQADLFDSELDAAADLGKRGFIRGGGAIAGVVLEKHLAHACESHGLKTRKKNPTINDYNQMLKDAKVIDTAAWRFIQHLGDLRNLCDHAKERDPTKDDVLELVEGVRKISRTVT